jgi:hypothetical protein
MGRFRHIAVLWIFITILVHGAYAGSSNTIVIGTSSDIGVVEEGEDAIFHIPLRNESGHPVKILSVDPFCDYVEVFPYPVEVGAGEEIILRGRIETSQTLGKIAKTLEIVTSDSAEAHIVHISLFVKHPILGHSAIEGIFQGRCGKCHAGEGIHSKTGEILFYKACYMCHKDGTVLSNKNRDAVSMKIMNGIPGTSMPGFGKERGGPLSAEQVGSLVEFLLGREPLAQ